MQQRSYFEKQALDKQNLTEFQNIDNQTPRKRFEQDLFSEIQQYQQNGHELIIMGDFNETVTNKKSFLLKLMRKCKLTDVWSRQYPESPEFATYYRGKHRIDYCLTTTEIALAVENIQYTDFFSIANSDHAGIVIDITTANVFPKRSKVQTHHERGLLSNDYRQLPKYIQQVYDHLDSNNVFEQMKKIKKSKILNVDAIEKIDRLISQACESGEKQIKKRRKPWWSLELHTTRYTLNIVYKAITQLRKGRYDRVRLQATLDSHQCHTELPQSLNDLHTLKKELRNKLYDISKQSKEKRDEFLTKHANTATNQGHEQKANITKAIQHTERLNRAFKTMSSIRKPVQANGVTMIKIPASWGTPAEAIANPESLEDPATATNWKEITDVKAIQQYMLARNRKHFHQAYGTPLTLQPWPNLLDWAGSSPTALSILEGKFDTTALPDIQATIIKHCKREFEQPIVHRELSPHEMVGKLKSWRETTSTSPSGRHLGHYRAMIQSLKFIADQEARETLEAYQHSIINLYTDVINYATRFGYTLNRWRTIESTMIPKDVGNAKIHRLRVIHIFEADYNLLLGVKWRDIIWKLENTGGLHPGQHGSRPGHQATDLTLLEELTFDISRCSRTLIGNFDNDASACYDRVVAEFASLASLSHGHHPSLIKTNTQALKDFKYFIRNTTNDTTAHYQHSQDYPIYGTGQGCANSPTVWCLVSSTLFKAHQTSSNGAKFHSPDKSTAAEFSMVGFVDDSTGRVNKFNTRPQPTVQQITELMSEDAQKWHDALEFSGGKLELPKCSYHLLSYQFKPNGKAIPVEHPNLPNLHVTSKNESIPITRMSIYRAHKTLGHWKAPAGDGITNLDKLQQKANKIALQINSSHLARTFVWLMYLSIYVAAIKYTLPQSSYSSKALQEAQRQSMRTIIGTCGFSRNTPLVILYGPTHLGGAGFLSWYTLQGEGQLISFLQHWRTHTDVGSMLRISLLWAQHFAGTSRPMLNDHESNLHYVPAKWIKAVRAFLKHINGTIQIFQTTTYPIQRHNDRHLMDIAHQSGSFDSHELEHLNYCRLYLQVTTVSDISTEEGTHIQSGAYHGPRKSLYSTSKWEYPVQPKPEHTSWTLWLRLLDLIATPSQKLCTPLGAWLYNAQALTRHWNEYRHFTGDSHYIQQLTHPDKWVHLKHEGKSWVRTSIVTSLPLHELFPCSSTMDMNKSLQWFPSIAPKPMAATFHEFLHQQPTETQHFLSHIELFTDPYTLMAALQNTEPNYLTTDGASLPLRTAYGWILALDDQHILAEGNGPGAGSTTSYRAEAYGLHAGVKFLHLLCQFTNQSFDQLTILCDNKSIIQKAETRHQYKTPFPTSTTIAEWDQLESAHHTILSLDIDIDYLHVKGHQDDTDQELDFHARMNIRADFLAGDYIHNNITPCPTVPVDSVSQCHLQIGTRTITSNHRQEIRDASSAPFLRQHIITFCSKRATSSMIDWNVFSTSNQRMRHLRVWNTKFIYNLLPTVRPEKTYTYDRPRCLSCPTKIDTWLHTLSCPETSRRKHTLTILQDIRQYLITINTCPDMLPALIAGIRTALLQQDPAFGRHHRLFTQQEILGWTNFIKGIWHKQWCPAQDSYLRETHQYNVHSTGTLWAIKLIVYMREQIHQRWVDHTHHIHNPVNAPSAVRQRLLARIQNLQNQYATIFPHLTHQFFIDTTASHHTHTTLQNWLTLHEPVITQAISLHQQPALTSQSLITTYFT